MYAEKTVGEEFARKAAERAEVVPGATLETAARRHSRTTTALELLARSLRHDKFPTAALAVANELARLLNCDRVSIGMRGFRQLQVCAVSNTTEVSRRQTAVRRLQAAMREAIDKRTVIVFPMPDKRAAKATAMHADLARETGRSVICTVPLLVHGAIVGAITCERDQRVDGDFIETIKDAACVVGPVLALQYRLSRPVAGPFLPRLERLRARRSASVLSWKEGLGLAAGFLLIVAAAWPATYTISSPALVEGSGQQVIAAPVDGFIKSVLHRPGDKVMAGDLLLTLNDDELKRIHDKWQVELTQLDRAYRDALSNDEASEIVLARAKRDQADIQLRLAEQELARASLVAPVDGIVVSGDLTDSLGMPVERGQELFVVAPTGRYRVVAQVDEQDIALIQPGQKGEVLFAALGGHGLEVQTTRISPVARTVDRRNMFEVDNRLASEDVQLYHGMTGVARIDIDRRSFGSIVWLGISQKFKRLMWRLIG